MNYDELNILYKNNEFRKIDKEKNAKKFYLLRSISKEETINKFCKTFNLEKNFNKILSSNDITEETIIKFIKDETVIKTTKQLNDIEAELSKVRNFSWGSSRKNSLENNIIDNYVKKISKYDEIENAVYANIQYSVHRYTLSSWYNYWSTVMIENIFNKHERVLPTVDKIEKIDFFIDSIPFDLKVTYFPDGLIKDEIKKALKEKYGSVDELKCAKKIANELNLPIPDDLNQRDLTIYLNERLRENKNKKAQSFINDLRKMKKDIINYYIENPQKLIVWLYENQGERRFDASNRFFIVLVDSNNIYDSWKLKINGNFLRKKIYEKLNSFDKNKLKEIKFHWAKDGKDYHCNAEILFIIK